MFSSTGLFSSTRCPNIDQCRLPKCIFDHSKNNGFEVQSSQSEAPRNELLRGPEMKRRKLENGDFIASARPGQPSSVSPPSKQKEANYVGTLNAKKPATEKKTSPKPPRKENGSGKISKPVQSIKRAVSPPPLRASKRDVTETLNPRKLQKDPAGHVTRVLFLSKLHEAMKKLNDRLLKELDAEAKKLHLSESELVKLALDEEEKIARESPLVYGNVVKLRIVAYTKMGIEDWKKLRAGTRATKTATTNGGVDNGNKPLQTGLKPDEEVAVARALVTELKGLEKYGYVTKAPTEAELSQARNGVQSAAGWEQCDRCKTRFQVFPERNEEGALTSRGICNYHFGRTVRPPQGEGAPFYACCNEPIGASTGCTVADCHVFKIADPKRLASVLQFEETPANPGIVPGRAVAVDCEMGYTVYGLELIRLTATAWPSGEELLDVLVQPVGTVLDLNSRFSGVWPEQYMDAMPYDSGRKPRSVTKHADNGIATESASPLRKVDSPAAARKLLFEHLSPATPLIGHAIENDLNAMRVIHPCVIDTVLLFPHPAGLPNRFGLKMLMKKHLDRDVQMGGMAGHDSKEDARAAGDLVRLRLATKWTLMKAKGWTIDDGVLKPPLPQAGLPGSSKVASKDHSRTSTDVTKAS